MSLLDDYQNINDESGQAADPADARRKRAEIERQIAIVDSDFKRTLREIESLEIQKRNYKKQEERLRVDEDALDKELKKLQDDRSRLKEEIQGLRKKLKTMH